MIGESTVVASKKGLITTHLSGETLILNIDSGHYFGLDAVASSVWQLLNEPIRVDRICLGVMEEYEVPADLCAREVVALLTDLHEKKLLEVRNDGPLGQSR